MLYEICYATNIFGYTVVYFCKLYYSCLVIIVL